MKLKEPDSNLKVHSTGRSKANESGADIQPSANFFTGQYQFSHTKKPSQKMPKGSVAQL